MTHEEALVYSMSPEGQQAARNYLSAALQIENRIALRLSRLDALRAQGERITQALGGMRGSGYGDKVGEAAAELADQEAALLKDYRQLLGRQRAIGEVIHQVPDEQAKLVLELRYLQNLSFVAIAMKVHCDERQAYRYHKRGIAHVAFHLALGGLTDTP